MNEVDFVGALDVFAHSRLHSICNRRDGDIFDTVPGISKMHGNRERCVPDDPPIGADFRKKEGKE
jgi:hypothetical protein